MRTLNIERSTSKIEGRGRAEQLTLIWTSEIIRDGNGRVRLVAKEPKRNMSTLEVASLLGVSVDTVQDLYQLGFIKGSKPGARVQRKDGRASNAKLVLDSESVMRYKAECDAAGRVER